MKNIIITLIAVVGFLLVPVEALAADLDETVRFRCRGSVISAQQNPNGTTSLILNLSLGIDTPSGRQFRGSGLALTAETEASPDGSFRCCGIGHLQGSVVSGYESVGRPVYQFELRPDTIRFRGGGARQLSDGDILIWGLLGEASANPDGS